MNLIDLNGNNCVDAVIDVLQDLNKDFREVAYYGVAEAIVSKLLATNEIKAGNVVDKFKLEKELANILDWLGRKAIINQSTLEAITRRILKYNINKTSFDKRLEEAGSWKCLNDILGITQCYSTGEIYNINRYFERYKLALIAGLKLLNNDKVCKEIFKGS